MVQGVFVNARDVVPAFKRDEGGSARPRGLNFGFSQADIEGVREAHETEATDRLRKHQF